MTLLLRRLLCLGLLTAAIAVGRSIAPAGAGVEARDVRATASAVVATPTGAAPVLSSPTPAEALVADRLFFGAIPGGGSVLDEAWELFLRDVVTPRFSEGLTVWRAEGQWTDSRGRVVREPVMVVEILHPADARQDWALAEIAREYKRRFRQEAVLRVTAPAQVRFH